MSTDQTPPQAATAQTAPPAVIVVSSHVARGSVGLRAAGFVLEARGHAVWSVPTVSLPFHPGHGQSTRIVADPEQFGSFLDDLAGSPWIGEVAGLLTGYLGDAGQVEAVAAFAGKLKKRNSGLTYLCDPVIGDRGGLYVAEAVASGIKDKLLPLADIATPNCFELSWLAGRNLATPDDLPGTAELARHLPCAATVTTSAPAFMRGNIASLYCDGETSLAAEHRRLENVPSGTGDLFSALFLSHRLCGTVPSKALERAAASTFEVIADAVKNRGDELSPQRHIGSLQRPMAMVSMRTLAPTQTVSRKPA